MPPLDLLRLLVEAPPEAEEETVILTAIHRIASTHNALAHAIGRLGAPLEALLASVAEEHRELEHLRRESGPTIERTHVMSKRAPKVWIDGDEIKGVEDVHTTEDGWLHLSISAGAPESLRRLAMPGPYMIELECLQCGDLGCAGRASSKDPETGKPVLFGVDSSRRTYRRGHRGGAVIFYEMSPRPAPPLSGDITTNDIEAARRRIAARGGLTPKEIDDIEEAIKDGENEEEHRRNGTGPFDPKAPGIPW